MLEPDQGRSLGIFSRPRGQGGMFVLRSLFKKAENVKLYAISVDPPDVSKSFAEKIAADGKGKVNFPLLYDPEQIRAALDSLK